MTKTGARPYSDLRAKMSPESRARAQRRAKKMLAEMPLHELRHAHEMSQKHLAEILGINQASVSKLERRAAMYISTLRQPPDYVLMGGGQPPQPDAPPHDGDVDLNGSFPVQYGGEHRHAQLRKDV